MLVDGGMADAFTTHVRPFLGNLAALVEGDTRLFNQYGVIVVNPARHPHTKTALAQAFADWVVSPAGQAVIAAYKVEGEPVFFANARP